MNKVTTSKRQTFTGVIETEDTGKHGNPKVTALGHCCGLNKNGHYRLEYLNVLLGSGAAWERLGGAALWGEETCHWARALGFRKPKPGPMIIILSAACGSRCGALSFFSSTVYAYVLPSFCHDENGLHLWSCKPVPMESLHSNGTLNKTDTWSSRV